MSFGFHSEQHSQQYKPNRALPSQRHLQELLFLVAARRHLQAMVYDWNADGPHSGHDIPRSEQSVSTHSGAESQKFERLRQKYEALLEGAPDAVFVADVQSGDIVEANEAAATLLDTTVDEIIGRHQSSLHPPEEAEKYKRLFERHQRAAMEKERATLRTLEDGSQICIVTDTGKKIPVEINASFVSLNDEKFFVGIFRDISERLRREEALRDAKEAAEQASELKSAMLRNMSHEIRTPITSIIGFSKILVDSLEGTYREHADNIHRASQRLMKTIDSVLELSKLEAEAQELEREWAGLDEAARWARELLGPWAENRELDLRAELPERPVRGRWNQEALNQIVEHLLENAIKFTPPGGTVELRVWRDADAAVLEVEDTGIGMDPDAVPELFEPFGQASEGLTREYGGVGLGLPIVTELVEVLGGSIEVQTEKDAGSCVTVRLPVPEDETATQTP